MFDYIVTGMVLHEAMTGYDIKKEIEAGVGNFYKASHGSLYPALKRLTEKGDLTMAEKSQGNRLKKYYQATETGKAAFLEWLSVPLDPNKGGELILAKIYFFGELSRDVRTKRLEELEFFAHQMLQQLNEIEKTLPSGELTEQDYFAVSTFYYGYVNVQNTIRWLGYIKAQNPLSEFLSKEDKS